MIRYNTQEWKSVVKVLSLLLFIPAVFVIYFHGYTSFMVRYLGALLFIFAVVLTAIACGAVYRLDWAVHHKFHSPNLYFFFGELAMPLTVFALLVTLLMGVSDDLLNLVVNAPDYVLFPCEHLNELDSLKEQEVLKVWRKKFLTDFSC